MSQVLSQYAKSPLKHKNDRAVGLFPPRHDPDAWMPFSRLGEALSGDLSLSVNASAGEAWLEKIMFKQQAKAEWRFNLNVISL